METEKFVMLEILDLLLLAENYLLLAEIYGRILNTQE
jgi:hypothetical protein